MSNTAAPQTTGGIGYPRLYDLLIGILTRGRERQYRDAMLDVLDVAPGLSVLDIGCGTGTLAIAAWRRSQPGGSVAGTDISASMLEVARRKARRAGAAVRFRQGDATSLPFDDAEFDVVTMTTVMHAVPENQRKRCIAETRRVLRPAGRLVLIDFGGEPGKRKHWSARHGAHGAFDLDDLREPLLQEGFRELEGGALHWLSLHVLRAERG